MLLRTVVLLFVCVSTGLCATLGHYQIQPKEDEAPLVDSAAVTDGVVAAEEAAAPADTQLGDSPAVEEPSIFGDNLLAEILAEVNPSDDKPKVDIPVSDGATAKEPETDSEKPAGDFPAMEALTGEAVAQEQPSSTEEEVNPADDKPKVDVPVSDGATAEEPETDSERPAGDSPAMEALTGEAVAQEQPSSTEEEVNPSDDKPKVDVPVSDGATAEEPETDSERPAGEPPAMEALTGEAVAQEQPSSTEEEKDNDIRPVQTNQFLSEPLAEEEEEEEEESSWSLNSIRNSFQSMHGYFGSLVELAGGHDGVCQYHCRYGQLPQPRPGYQLPEPNGCSSSLVGFQIDLGIPAMTTCCNQLDLCYDSCGASKEDCDSEFRFCLQGICSDLKKSLGFVSKVQACESVADALHSTVETLGCRPYLNSQRAACVCEGEERDEL